MPAASRIRLLVPSPHVPGRLLARPNGVSGWALPAIGRVGPADAPWDPDTARRVAAVLGVDADDLGDAHHLHGDLWLIAVRGRLPRVGNDWIGVDELDRLGADAAAVRTAVRDRDGESRGAGEWASGAEGATS